MGHSPSLWKTTKLDIQMACSLTSDSSIFQKQTPLDLSSKPACWFQDLDKAASLKSQSFRCQEKCPGLGQLEYGLGVYWSDGKTVSGIILTQTFLINLSTKKVSESFEDSD
jgi:hypothetical protein